MKLQWFAGEFCVCRLRDLDGVDLSGETVFLAKTRDEVSLVCAAEAVPAGAESVEKGWRMFRVAGQLDFGLVGILAGITKVLAEAGVSVFVVSTFDTDYVLVKGACMPLTSETLSAAGYVVE